MSRIGKMPILIPDGVKCNLSGTHLQVTGPKGELTRELHPEVMVQIEGKSILVSRPSDKGAHRALHGLTRALISNMVDGVTKGYEKTLKVEGVGYRASLQGKSLNLAVGYSHPVLIEPPDGIVFAVPDSQTIKISGIDIEKVGQMAADVRAWRKPEPYKGKGIRYEQEHIRRKVGKAGSK